MDKFYEEDERGRRHREVMERGNGARDASSGEAKGVEDSIESG